MFWKLTSYKYFVFNAESGTRIRTLVAQFGILESELLNPGEFSRQILKEVGFRTGKKVAKCSGGGYTTESEMHL